MLTFRKYTVVILALLIAGGAFAQDIFQVARQGDLETVKSLIGAEASLLNAADERGVSPLGYAMISRNAELVKWLIQAGADLERPEGSIQPSPKLLAAYFMGPSMLNYIDSLGVDLMPLDSLGDHGLFWAARMGNTESMKWFLDRGLDASLKNGETGETALHIAAHHGQVDAVNLLIEKGARVNARDNEQTTPLHAAAEGQEVETLRILLDNGARINARTKSKETAFDLALKDNVREAIELLIQRGVEVNVEGETGRQTLHNAALQGQTVLVDYMMEHGVDIRTRNDIGGSLLHSAASGGAKKCVSTLLEAGFPVDETDGNGLTPLVLAAFGGHVEIMDQLVAKGANFKALESRLVWLARHGRTQGLARLLEMGLNVNVTDEAGNTPLHLAARFNYPETAGMLLEKGADVNAVNHQKETPLHMAILGGNKVSALALLEAGASGNALDRSKNSPLHLCAQARWDDVTETILEKGVKAGMKNKLGKTPLHLAASVYDNGAVINRLIERGADIDARDRRKRTPLICALDAHRIGNAKLLLKKGADASIQDKQKRTAREIAQSRGMEDVAAMMK